MDDELFPGCGELSNEEIGRRFKSQFGSKANPEDIYSQLQTYKAELKKASEMIKSEDEVKAIMAKQMPEMMRSTVEVLFNQRTEDLFRVIKNGIIDSLLKVEAITHKGVPYKWGMITSFDVEEYMKEVGDLWKKAVSEEDEGTEGVN